MKCLLFSIRDMFVCKVILILVEGRGLEYSQRTFDAVGQQLSKPLHLACALARGAYVTTFRAFAGADITFGHFKVCVLWCIRN